MNNKDNLQSYALLGELPNLTARLNAELDQLIQDRIDRECRAIGHCVAEGFTVNITNKIVPLIEDMDDFLELSAAAKAEHKSNGGKGHHGYLLRSWLNKQWDIRESNRRAGRTNEYSEHLQNYYLIENQMIRDTALDEALQFARDHQLKTDVF